MNMLCVTEIKDAARVELLDLDAMPHDRVAIYAARRELSARDYGVWTILREHLWEYGSLPTGPRALARIAGIGTESFIRAAPRLARHFDRTEHGAWSDDFLMRRRGTSLVVPSPELPAVDPALSAARRASGSAGGLASAARRQAAAEARRGGGADPATPGAGVLLQPEAKAEANGQANRGDTVGDFASGFASCGEASASLAPGWLVGLNPEDSGKTNQPTARASEAKSEAAGQANLEASGSLGQARAEATDGRMIEAILAACPGKIAPGTARWGIKTVKAWIAKGCSFEADYLPTLRAFGSTNQVVKNVGNELILEETFAARDRRLSGAPAPARPDLSRMSPFGRGLHEALEAKVGAPMYLSWGARIEASVEDGVATLAVPTRFLKTYLSANLSRELEAAARAAQPDVRQVVIEVRRRE